MCFHCVHVVKHVDWSFEHLGLTVCMKHVVNFVEDQKMEITKSDAEEAKVNDQRFFSFQFSFLYIYWQNLWLRSL